MLSSLALGVRVELAVGGLLSLSGGGSLGEALVVHHGVLGAVGQVGGAIGGGSKLAVGGGSELGVSGGGDGGGGVVLVQVSPGLSAVGVLDGLLGGALVAVEGLKYPGKKTKVRLENVTWDGVRRLEKRKSHRKAKKRGKKKSKSAPCACAKTVLASLFSNIR